ncbi:gamma-glutamylcyclotransferase [Akkermansiaceae bacterium]|nr:gamma-glutamylcyclotransferase [Akkermansiaceae bacterium]
MNVNPVFVYGTLKKGGSNHFRMGRTSFVGAGRIFGKMYRIDWYPALVCGGDSLVRGELYLVSDADLAALDRFEGITPETDEPREYRRVKTMVTLDSGETGEAWVWEWAGGIGAAIPLDGEDWLAYEPNPS